MYRTCADHEFFLRGDVFTQDFFSVSMDDKMERDVRPSRLHPTPVDFFHYYDVWSASSTEPPEVAPPSAAPPTVPGAFVAWLLELGPLVSRYSRFMPPGKLRFGGFRHWFHPVRCSRSAPGNTALSHQLGAKFCAIFRATCAFLMEVDPYPPGCYVCGRYWPLGGYHAGQSFR